MNQLLLIALLLSSVYVYGGNTMEPVNVEAFSIHGIEISTTNDIEMNSDNPKIPDLWKVFYTEHYGKLLKGSPVYGVYSNYESDVNGQYSVLAGVKTGDTKGDYTELTIEEGKYLIFRKEGEPIKAVISAWQEVWEYFSNSSSQYKRVYTKDFEVYENDNSVAIYIV